MAGSGPYSSGDTLQRQRSVPAAAAAFFVPCGQAPINGGFRRAFVDDDDGGCGEGKFSRLGYPAVVRPAGVGLVRVLWRRIMRQKRKMLNQKGSSAREQYDHEEYAQNFDDGGAAGEPENLSRSFSARYAGAARAPRAGGLLRW